MVTWNVSISVNTMIILISRAFNIIIISFWIDN